MKLAHTSEISIQPVYAVYMNLNCGKFMRRPKWQIMVSDDNHPLRFSTIKQAEDWCSNYDAIAKWKQSNAAKPVKFITP